MLAVLANKTKATKEARDTDTEDSGGKYGGIEEAPDVEVVEVDEVDEVDSDPKKKSPRINWRNLVHQDTLMKEMQEVDVARDYISVPRTTIIYYQGLITATGKSIDEFLPAYGCPLITNQSRC
jgi:hypothetical protein